MQRALRILRVWFFKRLGVMGSRFGTATQQNTQMLSESFELHLFIYSQGSQTSYIYRNTLEWWDKRNKASKNRAKVVEVQPIHIQIT